MKNNCHCDWAIAIIILLIGVIALEIAKVKLLGLNVVMELEGRIVIYSIIGCPHCLEAKNTLQELNLPYHDIDLENYSQLKNSLKQKTGKSTVPQIFFNNIFIGGNVDLQKFIKKKEEFEKLIEELRITPPPADAPQIPDPITARVKEATEFECEPDEYAILVKELKESGLIKNHRSGLRVHKNSFSGKDFVKWMKEKRELDKDRALEMGQILISKHFGKQVGDAEEFKDDGTYYRLLEDDESTALNAGETAVCSPNPVNDLGEEIRRLILKLYAAFLTPDGKQVDYKGIAESKEYQLYKKLTKELVRVEIENASKEEKIAFFINIYNALVIHANIEKGPPTNLWQRYKFFNTVRYVIGGHSYSLQDIENGVLRANRKGVGMFFKPFSASDPRLKIALEKHEPLIHFALVCGAKSCPPIKTYSADGIESQLKLAAEAFLEGDDSIKINITKKEVHLSMIMKWYREDFGKDHEEVLTFLHSLMSDGEKKTQLKELLDGKKYKVSHMPYDWGVNSKPAK